MQQLDLFAPPTVHRCHWPGCPRVVDPSLWGCRWHWYLLPKKLRDAIWRTYRTGQEKTKTPSPQYIAAARAVQDWIRDHGAAADAAAMAEARAKSGRRARGARRTAN